MTHRFASADTRFPLRLADGSAHPGTVFLSAAIEHPRWDIGAYSYASSFDPPADWAARLAPHLFAWSPERLVIGRFCQIAHGAVFITASANHRRDGVSTYPFAIFDDGPMTGRPSLPESGPDTVIGDDVWIGQGATILPGAVLGDGVIIGAGAVVGGRAPDYAVLAGNPARVVKMRFDANSVARLKALAWWRWPIEQIQRCEAEIAGGDIDALERAARRV
ncbi:MAG: CatB-related O-acetyltransferase [Pseudomonadota bacterium]